MNQIADLVKLFSRKTKLHLFNLQILLIFSGFLEILSLLFIGSLLSLIFTQDLENLNFFLKKIYYNFEFNSIYSYTKYLAFFSTIFFILSSAITLLASWISLSFANKIGYELSNNLINHYLNQNWLYHLRIDNSVLIKKIQLDAQRLSEGFLAPLLLLNSKIPTIIFIFIFMVYLNWKVAFINFLFIGLFYLIFYINIKKYLDLLSKSINNSFVTRQKTLNEIFSGIKDIILFNAQSFFFSKFKKNSDTLSKDHQLLQFLMLLPKSILELFIMFIILLILFFFSSIFKESILNSLDIIGIYIFGALKLIPIIQQSFQNISNIKSSKISFYSVFNDLIIFKKKGVSYHDYSPIYKKKFEMKKNIVFKKVFFSYNNQYILNNFSFTIEKNKMIGIVGGNGEGKSTFIDLLLGVLMPNRGNILVDNVKLTNLNSKFWFESIGYVSQKPFLFDNTIKENIFLTFKQKINHELFDKISKFIGFKRNIKQFQRGLETRIKENGQNLSGGQIQKIAIFRCLYKDSSLIVFDEPTNSLDRSAIILFLDTLKILKGNKTIVIVSHDKKILKFCDYIYRIQKGEIKKVNYSKLQ